MTNKSANYKSLYNPTNMTAGGAAGAVTVDKVPAGDAYAANNTQQYGFQFGTNATATTGKFTARTRIMTPFAGITPQDSQSMGLFIGNGDQNNYVKLVTIANNGAGGIQFAKEVSGSFAGLAKPTVSMPGPDYVDLYLAVDPAANTVQASYVVSTNGVTSLRKDIGTPTSIPAGWFGGTTGFAIGIISTSAGPGPEFPATWGFIEVTPGCTIPGTANADTISGTSADDVICAEDGNDTILGGVGNDTLDGGLGTDTASYSASLTAVNASLTTKSSTGEGSDTFLGVENLLGSSKADTLTGSTTNNKLTGGGSIDTLLGGGGNDSVIGSGGADTLKGEDGADTVNSRDGVNGNDSLDGGAGTDTKVTDPTEKSIVNFP